MMLQPPSWSLSRVSGAFMRSGMALQSDRIIAEIDRSARFLVDCGHCVHWSGARPHPRGTILHGDSGRPVCAPLRVLPRSAGAALAASGAPVHTGHCVQCPKGARVSHERGPAQGRGGGMKLVDGGLRLSSKWGGGEVGSKHCEQWATCWAAEQPREDYFRESGTVVLLLTSVASAPWRAGGGGARLATSLGDPKVEVGFQVHKRVCGPQSPPFPPPYASQQLGEHPHEARWRGMTIRGGASSACSAGPECAALGPAGRVPRGAMRQRILG
eukprot:CAMPEP_0174318182 /NCGR_PEP_ID=MMETSP0810-20121108/8047_1 /TAXON_ID=73025 ORGANISM="Eutreptiella gymnastica-like, Strain CCMP1594" /NCGR_SAMPLE_ID=MMETSP0810 /ASSEMBLY_ACC=CAM_ASM_000659 /LENGTH=270 /DNA_ID=CAMNT_0015428345 /DNA_START=912 /DNA_END=1719 /DNA_ORIENTATION=+